MKKKFIIILSLIIVIIGVGVGMFFYFKKEKKPITVKKLNYVDLTNAKTESDKVELIKNNTIKIINKINNDISIIGTGFFDTDGYLITNSHVVDIKGDITIEYPDGSTTSANLISNDIASDVALLAVEDTKVKALEFADTLNLKTADTLYAIGYPLNLDGEPSVTKGILSARRSIAGVEYLQTDAAIDNGSSGGPLINTEGYLVGMNSLASNTSNINLALSSETIQNIIAKLKTNQEVTYITGERETNAMSNILREVGYTEIDIYNEWDIINQIYNLHIGVGNENSNGASSEKSNGPLDSDSIAKSISVEGYNIGFNSYEYSYKFHLLNGEDTIKINVVPNSPKAKYNIVGNGNFKLGSNIVSVIITAENGSKTTYTLYVMKPVNELDGIVGIRCNGANFNGPSIINISYEFIDSRGDSVYNSDYPMHVANTIYVEAYVKVAPDATPEKTLNGAGVRFLKSYSFKASSSINTTRIPADELRGLMNENEYEEDGTAKIYFAVTINTFKNGSFNTVTPAYSLKK